MFRKTLPRMARPSNDYVGATGSLYRLKHIIQERPYVGRVWLAMSGQHTFVLKDIPRGIFDNFNENIRPRLRQSPYLRLPCDTIPGQRIFVYKYMTDDFLSLVKRGISMRARKQILKSTVLGIASLHEQQIVHLDIKPDNIMVNYQYRGEETIIEDVRLTDLENAAYLPKGRCIKGMLAGNDNWRSPEAHFRGKLNQPTDMFAFGTVCIYAFLGRIIFGPDDDFRLHQGRGALPALIRLQRQVSYFGDQQGINGLLRYITDDETNGQVLRMLWEERTDEHIPYKPFAEWPDVVDSAFRELIKGVMNLDPAKRLTARDVLEHPWFADV